MVRVGIKIREPINKKAQKELGKARDGGADRLDVCRCMYGDEEGPLLTAAGGLMLLVRADRMMDETN